MKITNLTANVIEIHDGLANGLASQYQDGVRTVVIGPTGSTRVVVRAGVDTTIPNDYRVIPNLMAANSMAVKALLTASSISVDATIEPTGATTNPENEINGPIIGMPGI